MNNDAVQQHTEYRTSTSQIFGIEIHLSCFHFPSWVFNTPTRMHTVSFYLFHILYLCQRFTREVKGPHSGSQEQPTTQRVWCFLKLAALINQLHDNGNAGQKQRQPPHPMQVTTSVPDQQLTTSPQ